jgi:chromosome partitioning protein
LKIGGVLIIAYDGERLTCDCFETINEHFKSEVFKKNKTDNIVLAEAPAQGQDIFRYRPKVTGQRTSVGQKNKTLSKTCKHFT